MSGLFMHKNNAAAFRKEVRLGVVMKAAALWGGCYEKKERKEDSRPL